MTPLQLHQFLLQARPFNLQTFGGHSTFSFDYIDGELFIISSQGIRSMVPGQIFLTVLDRYNSLPDNLRTVTTQFGNNWPGCPDPHLSPWVGRIIHYFETGR
jgi:hypothetical protein